MTHFYVQGRDEFPFDMLRYDMCWPKDAIDAAKLTLTAGGRRTICLQTDGRWIAVRRWKSFGWSVLINQHNSIPENSPLLNVSGSITTKTLMALMENRISIAQG